MNRPVFVLACAALLLGAARLAVGCSPSPTFADASAPDAAADDSPASDVETVHQSHHRVAMDYPSVGGDLSGSTNAATVVGIRGKTVPSPGVGVLQYDGGSYSWGAVPLASFPPGTAGQALITNGVDAAAWATPSLDVSMDPTGAFTVGGLQGAALPSLGPRSYVLQYVDGAWQLYAGINGGTRPSAGAGGTTTIIAENGVGDAGAAGGGALVLGGGNPGYVDLNNGVTFGPTTINTRGTATTGIFQWSGAAGDVQTQAGVVLKQMAFQRTTDANLHGYGILLLDKHHGLVVTSTIVGRVTNPGSFLTSNEVTVAARCRATCYTDNGPVTCSDGQGGGPGSVAYEFRDLCTNGLGPVSCFTCFMNPGGVTDAGAGQGGNLIPQWQKYSELGDAGGTEAQLDVQVVTEFNLN